MSDLRKRFCVLLKRVCIAYQADQEGVDLGYIYPL